MQGLLLEIGTLGTSKGCPPLWGGRARHVESMPQTTAEASSSASCALHGLDDVVSTPISEPTSSLHDDGLPFDRGK